MDVHHPATRVKDDDKELTSQTNHQESLDADAERTVDIHLPATRAKDHAKEPTTSQTNYKESLDADAEKTVDIDHPSTRLKDDGKEPTSHTKHQESLDDDVERTVDIGQPATRAKDDGKEPTGQTNHQESLDAGAERTVDVHHLASKLKEDSKDPTGQTNHQESLDSHAERTVDIPQPATRLKDDSKEPTSQTHHQESLDAGAERTVDVCHPATRPKNYNKEPTDQTNHQEPLDADAERTVDVHHPATRPKYNAKEPTSLTNHQESLDDERTVVAARSMVQWAAIDKVLDTKQTVDKTGVNSDIHRRESLQTTTTEQTDTCDSLHHLGQSVSGLCSQDTDSARNQCFTGASELGSTEKRTTERMTTGSGANIDGVQVSPTNDRKCPITSDDTEPGVEAARTAPSDKTDMRTSKSGQTQASPDICACEHAAKFRDDGATQEVQTDVQSDEQDVQTDTAALTEKVETISRQAQTNSDGSTMTTSVQTRDKSLGTNEVSQVSVEKHETLEKTESAIECLVKQVSPAQTPTSKPSKSSKVTRRIKQMAMEETKEPVKDLLVEPLKTSFLKSEPPEVSGVERRETSRVTRETSTSSVRQIPEEDSSECDPSQTTRNISQKTSEEVVGDGDLNLQGTSDLQRFGAPELRPEETPGYLDGETEAAIPAPEQREISFEEPETDNSRSSLETVSETSTAQRVDARTTQKDAKSSGKGPSQRHQTPATNVSEDVRQVIQQINSAGISRGAPTKEGARSQGKNRSWSLNDLVVMGVAMTMNGATPDEDVAQMVQEVEMVQKEQLLPANQVNFWLRHEPQCLLFVTCETF